MLNRRVLLAIAATSAMMSTAQAQDWKAKYPELVMATIPSENAAQVTERFGPFAAYLSREIGVPVKLRIAGDYAAVIEGQRAEQIHIAYYGPASYARARMIGVKTTPFAIEVNKGGVKGYHSVFYVKANSSYQKIEDLKGKNIALVDPNSTSGFLVPSYYVFAQRNIEQRVQREHRGKVGRGIAQPHDVSV